MNDTLGISGQASGDPGLRRGTGSSLGLHRAAPLGLFGLSFLCTQGCAGVPAAPWACLGAPRWGWRRRDDVFFCGTLSVAGQIESKKGNGVGARSLATKSEQRVFSDRLE